MCDPGGAIKDVALNFATGGLYSVGKGIEGAVEDGSLSPILNQGLDVGMAATGNQIAQDVAGPTAGSIVNAVGGGLGALGSAGVFASTAAEEAAPAIAESAIAPTEASAEAGTTETAAGDLYGNETRPLLMQNQPIAAQGEMLPEGEIAGAAKPAAVPAPAPSTGVTSGGDVSPLQEGPSTGEGSVPSVRGTPTSGVAQSFQAQTEDFQASTKAFIQKATNSPVLSQEAKDAVAKMDPVHLMLMLAGGQTVAGLGSGVLSSLSMSDQIALQKLVNSQQQGQIQYQNRNNQFAPTVQFAPPPGPKPSGLLTQPLP